MTLRFGVVNGRAHAIVGSIDAPVAVDVAQHSDLPSDPMSCIARWDDLRATSFDAAAGRSVTLQDLDCPVPAPRQMFAVGLNYRKHAEEMSSQIPAQPLVFAKFQSSLNSPTGDIRIASETCDYESEVIIVIARGGRNIDAADAWKHVAGLCVGQDISDRGLQYAGNPPQFSMGKSRQGFSPIGPWVTDMSNNERRNTLRVQCSINGELRQNSSTADMIFSVAEIISYISQHFALEAGDVICTGTPEGVIMGMANKVWLSPGDKVTVEVGELGKLTNVMAADS